MRVLHFAGSYFPVPGGTSTRIHNMLASPENEHLLVVPWPRSDQLSEETKALSSCETKDNLRIRRVNFPKTLSWIKKSPFLGNCVLAELFLKSIKNEKIDIIHGHNPRACAIASLKFKQKKTVPMIYEAHGIMADQSSASNYFGIYEGLNKMASWLDLRTARYYEKQVLRAADHIVVQTDIVKNRLMELYDLENKPIDVIRNGVDTERFDPDKWHRQGRALRDQYAWNNYTVCLYSGYLDKVNGIDFLLDSLEHLDPKSKKAVKIVLVGRGPLEQEVLQAAKKHEDLIEYHGPVSYEKMPAYYAAADVFMIPRPSCKQAETLVPMKLLEAMAMGKMLLVSNVAAMSEIITHKKNGYVFEKDNSADFLFKLEEIVNSTGDRSGYSIKARQDVLEKFAWETSRRQLQNIYNKLVCNS
ncbi:MAG: glycosyltransferase family 4 protein [Sedimentisphaerales bacterium]|nr:glycosyltransferase family 4 protein [Sedimentisphaerales bacterium]